ncbi:hypothetical protein AAVH_11632 [Aphelenchoides avenae]|nr:hypothetical protein AAVH_11632 [Aphelenchus avenae]
MDGGTDLPPAVHSWPLRRFSLLRSEFKPEKDYNSESAAQLSLVYKPSSKRFQVERLSRRLAEFCLFGVAHPPVISFESRAAKIRVKSQSDGRILSEFRVYFVTDGDLQSFTQFVERQASPPVEHSSTSEASSQMQSLSAGTPSPGSAPNHPSTEFPMTDWLSAFRVVNDVPAINSASAETVVAHLPGTSSSGVYTGSSWQRSVVPYTNNSSDCSKPTDHNAVCHVSDVVPQTIAGLYSQTLSSQHVGHQTAARSQDLFCVQDNGGTSQSNKFKELPLNFITPDPSQRSTTEIYKGGDSEDSYVLYSDASTQTTPSDLMQSLLKSPTRLKKVVQQAVHSAHMKRLVDCVTEVAPSLPPKPKKARRQAGSATREPLRSINDGEKTPHVLIED